MKIENPEMSFVNGPSTSYINNLMSIIEYKVNKHLCNNDDFQD